MNPKEKEKPKKESTSKEVYSRKHWKVGFRDKACGSWLQVFASFHRYLFWMGGSLSTQMETVLVVTKISSKSWFLGSDCPSPLGLTVAWLSQPKFSPNLAKVLNIYWKLYCSKKSQSSGQLKRRSKTLKKTNQIYAWDQWKLGQPPTFALCLS